MENFNKWKSQLDYFLEDRKYPLCNNCSSLILIKKFDILKNIIEYQCENCFQDKEINLFDYFNTVFRQNGVGLIEPTKICKRHGKEMTYFCKTCIRSNCDECQEKIIYPKHKFVNFKEIMIDENKIRIKENEANNEMDCLIKTLNINNLIDYYNNSNNEEIKKYKNKISSDILFSNKDFLRILYMNIYKQLLVPYCHKRLIEIIKEYPNDYFCIQNFKSINIFIDVINNNKNKIFEELLANSINILKNYNYEYLFEFMEIKSFNFKKFEKQFNWSFNMNSINPYMLLEDNNSVLYFGEEIFYINIETGEKNYYRLTDLPNFSSYNFCILENNKFIIYSENGMMAYKYENNTINKFFSQNFEVENIFKLFKGEYILIKNKNGIKIYHESHLNFNEIYHSDIKCVKMNSINYIGEKKENYFSAKDKKYKNLLIRINLNSKNEIVFNNVYLSINNINEYKFITGNKLFIELYNRQYIVYDLNYKQVEMVFGYKEKNCLKNIFKGIKNINKHLIKDFLFETNESDYYQYQKLYVLKRNKDEIYFICKKVVQNTLKVFKYTYMEDKYNNIISQFDYEDNNTNPSNTTK